MHACLHTYIHIYVYVLLQAEELLVESEKVLDQGGCGAAGSTHACKLVHKHVPMCSLHIRMCTYNCMYVSSVYMYVCIYVFMAAQYTHAYAYGQTYICMRIHVVI
jgi:hypothetical protein